MVGAVGAFSNAYLYQSNSNSSSGTVTKTDDSQQIEELLAQAAPKEGKRPQGPPPGGGPQGQSLTDEQSETVSDILEEYDSENLTEEDALAIASAFEEAGIEIGGGLRDAIEENGFDPEALAELAGFEQRPPQPPQGGQEISQMMMQEEVAQLSIEENEDLYESMEQAFSAMVAGLYSEQDSDIQQASYFTLSA